MAAMVVDVGLAATLVEYTQMQTGNGWSEALAALLSVRCMPHARSYAAVPSASRPACPWALH